MNLYPTVGCIVLFVLDTASDTRLKPAVHGKVRAAIISQVFHAGDDLRVNLRVLLDGPNDTDDPQLATHGILWAPSRPYATVATPGTWHWPPRV